MQCDEIENDVHIVIIPYKEKATKYTKFVQSERKNDIEYMDKEILDMGGRVKWRRSKG